MRFTEVGPVGFVTTLPLKRIEITRPRNAVHMDFSTFGGIALLTLELSPDEARQLMYYLEKWFEDGAGNRVDVIVYDESDDVAPWNTEAKESL